MVYTLTNPLCTLSDVKAALRITTSADDDRISLAIDASSRQLEAEYDRRFYGDTAATARTFVAETAWLTEVDDFYTTSGLVVETDPAGDGTFGITWTAADYQLEPLNNIENGQAGWPFTKIRAIRSFYFPIWGLNAFAQKNVQALVRITAKWGWATVPAAVNKAAIVQSIANFKADDVPFGATAFGETGIIRLRTALHPTAAALMAPYGDDDVMVG